MIGLGLQTLSLSLTRPTGPGLVQQVSNLFAQGEQGFWFDPSGNNIDWRRNQLNYTEQFDNDQYLKYEITVKANATNAPNATNTGSELVPNAVNAVHRVVQAQSSFNAQVASCYFKANGYNKVALRDWATGVHASFNLNLTSVIAKSSNVEASIIDIGNGWKRCVMITTQAETTGIQVYILAPSYISGDPNGSSFSGDGSSVFVWGIQYERGLSATSYQRIVTPEITYLSDVQSFPILYQDQNGTIPLTAVEQPVGLIFDKRKPLVFGPELVTTPSINLSGAQSTDVGVSVVAGKFYKVSATVTNYTGSGDLGFYGLIFTGTNGITRLSGNGTMSGYALALASSTIGLSGKSTNSATVSNISVKLLDGNHAYQTTATSRPTLRARYNLLTYSERFENAAWTKSSVTIAQNSVAGPTGAQTADTATASGANGTVRQALTLLATPYTFSVWIKRKTGTGNIDLSVDGTTWTTKTITTDWARYSVTQTPTAGANNPGVRIVTSGDEVYLWGAQLNYGSTATTYQSIDGATSYATGPDFPQYLDFDGADDSLLTASINFSGTDEMSVFAGVTKTSDAAQGMVAELTATTASNNGSWSLQAPDAAAAATYLFQSKGTNLTDAQKTSVAAVNTSILSGLSDISADTTKLRVNGVQAEEDTGDQGTGNFSNSIVYIGRRNNNTLPFKGRIYGLIVRGKTCDSSQIEAAERLLALPAQVTL